MSKTISFQALSETTTPSRGSSLPRAFEEGCWQETIGGSVLYRLFIEAQKNRHWQPAEQQNKQI